jgi:type IV pilus assembly protein PilE
MRSPPYSVARGSRFVDPYRNGYAMKLTQRGITLIELMTVLMIVAILAAIAIPSYSQYVRRSHRAEAKTALLENAQYLERNFTVSNSYAADGSGEAVTKDTLPVTRTPKEGGSAKYTIDYDSDGTSFTLTAVPAAGGPMVDDECGSLTLTNTGVKDTTSGNSASCWAK